MVAIAPALTIGLVARSALISTAITELNGSPVLFTPMWRRTSSTPSASQISANTNGLDTLWIENSLRGVADADRLTVHADDSGPERGRVGRGQRGDVVGDHTVVDASVPLVRLFDDRADLLRIRKMPGRDADRLVVERGEGGHTGQPGCPGGGGAGGSETRGASGDGAGGAGVGAPGEATVVCVTVVVVPGVCACCACWAA